MSEWWVLDQGIVFKIRDVAIFKKMEKWSKIYIVLAKQTPEFITEVLLL
jgi:hypothetical protein